MTAYSTLPHHSSLPKTEEGRHRQQEQSLPCHHQDVYKRQVQSDIQQGRPIIMGGDFNEPSHLDWQADTKDLWDHNGAIIHWDCSMMLSKAGFKDAYREKFPNTCLLYTSQLVQPIYGE